MQQLYLSRIIVQSMLMSEYQASVVDTAKSPALTKSNDKDRRSVVLLGLAGEVGELLGEYKKRLRDRDDHAHFRLRVKEKLGDVLWYVAATASYFNLQLEEVAATNVVKTNDRWGLDPSAPYNLPDVQPFDADSPETERFPRVLEIDVVQTEVDGVATIRLVLDGQQLGNDITDRSYEADGYRFHDVLHLAFVAILGWSPVLRNLLKLRRKGQKQTDMIEDGGRAIAIEEGITALAFAYARDRDQLASANMVDYELLHLIRTMTRHLEVSRCTLREWQVALLEGFDVWRTLEENGGGRVRLDLDRRSLTVVGADKA